MSIKNYNEYLLNENIMNIIELSKMLSRMGIDKDAVLNILQKEYKSGGDDAVISIFKEMSGIEIEALRKGAYVFKY